MILEKQSGLLCHRISTFRKSIHGNLGATEIGRIIRMRSDAKNSLSDAEEFLTPIAMLWEQEVVHINLASKKDDISFSLMSSSFYLLALYALKNSFTFAGSATSSLPVFTIGLTVE